MEGLAGCEAWPKPPEVLAPKENGAATVVGVLPWPNGLDEPKGAETGDCTFSAGFWPKENGDEAALWPKLAKDGVDFASGALTSLPVPKPKGEDTVGDG